MASAPTQLQQWADQVLRLVGAPISETNRQTLYKWARSESGSNPLSNGRVRNNPLNTKQPWPGAVDTGISVTPGIGGVKSYPDLSTSARATAATLTNGYYPDIISMLQNSVPTKSWSQAARAQVTKWGTSLGFLGGASVSQPTAPISQQSGASTFDPGAFIQQAATGLPAGTNPFDFIGRSIQAAGAGVGAGIVASEKSFTQQLLAAAEVALGSLMMLAGATILVVMVLKGSEVGRSTLARGRGAIGGALRGGPSGAAVGAATARPRPAAVKPAPAAAPPAEEPRVSAGGRVIELRPEARARLRSEGYAV